MTNIRKLIVPLLICTSLLSGCKNPFESKAKGVEKLNEMEKRWEDANNLASSTSRIALATPVANLQDLKNELDAVEVSECLAPAKKALYDAMNLNIDSFLMFMKSDNGETGYLSKRVQSEEKFIQYMDLKYKCVEKPSTTTPEATQTTSEIMADASATAIEAIAAASEAAAEVEALVKAEATEEELKH